MTGFKIKGLRWWIIGLLMLGSIINYLTRSTLAVAAPTLMKDLDISTQQYSWILNTFQSMIMPQPLCGYVMDVIGLKLAFAIFATAWSLICMAHGLAHNWQMLAGLRGLLGLAEGSANPAGMKATAEWFPAKERGFAGGLFNIGASVGSMLAPPLVGFAIYYYNWQLAFVLTGAIGLAWVALWLWFYNSPEKQRQTLTRGKQLHHHRSGKAFAGRRETTFNFFSSSAPKFLGHRHSTFFGGSNVEHVDILATALFESGAAFQFERNRIDRMVAVFSRRSGLHVRRRGRCVFAEAWCRAHQCAARRGAVTVGACLMTGILSDEACTPGTPNFTGAFVGMACLDLAGSARPADFDFFEYRERSYCPNLIETVDRHLG